MDSFDYASLILSCSAILLHCIGLSIMWNARSQLDASRGHIFIANFSVWCVFWALNNLIRYPVLRHGTVHVVAHWNLTVETARIPFYSAVLLITIVRFLQLKLHVNYEASFLNKHRLLIVIASFVFYAIWLVVSIVLFNFNKVSIQQRLLIPSCILTPAFHCAILLTFIVVYPYITKKLLNSSSGKGRFWKRLIVPSAIMFFFIVLEIVPDSLIVAGKSIYGSWNILMFRLDSNLNALFYIFMQPCVREKIKSFGFRSNRVSPLNFQ